MENRKINTNDLIGMDLRDFNLDQQHTKEIINLVKDKNGWKIRDPLKVVTNGIQSYNSINAFILPSSDRCMLHMDNSILLYTVSNDELGTLMEKWNFDYSFKLYKTNYPLVYFQIDTTNHKSYVLEFTDRVMTAINDVNNLDVSTELILNEFDTNTGDYTWGGIARHDTYTSNGNTYINGVDTYTINYDTVNQGQSSEWNTMSLLLQKDDNTRSQRYILVTGYGADTYLYIFGWNEYTPHKWATKLKVTGKNVFKIDGTGALNDKARFMDVITKASSIITYGAWQQFGSDIDLIRIYSIKYLNGNIYCGGTGGSFAIGPRKYNSSTNAWDHFGDNIYNSAVHDIALNGSDYYVGIDGGGIYKLTNGTGSWAKFGTGIESISVYCLYSSTACGTYGYGVKYYNSGSWDQLGTGINTGVVNSLIYDSGDYYCGLDSGGVKKLTGGVGAWNSVSSEISTYSILKVYDDGTHLYACSIFYGIWKLTNKTGNWAQFGTALSSSSIFDILKAGSDYYCATDSGIYKLTNGTGSWAQFGTGLSLQCWSLLNNGLNFYAGTEGNGIKSISYISSVDLSGDLEIYIPNDDTISRLNTYALATGASYVPVYACANALYSGAQVKAVKCINPLFSDSSTMSYLLTSINTQVQMYLLSVTGTRESGTVNTFILKSGTLSNAFTYSNFNGFHLVANRYYDTDIQSNSNCKGYTAFVAYSDNGNTNIDTIDITTGSTTATMSRVNVGSSISNSSPYYLGTSQYHVLGTGIASIFDAGDKHNIYIPYDRRMYQFPVTGNAMTQDDINSIKVFYNAEISGYADVDGIIMDAVVSYPKGYVTTEMNISKPLPLRPYFTPDAGDTLTNTAVITVYGDSAGVFSNTQTVSVNSTTMSNVQVNIRGATTSNTDNWRLYYKVNSAGTSRNVYFYSTSARTAGAQVLSTTVTIAAGASAVAVLAINNSSGFQAGNCNVKIYISSAYSDTVTNNQYVVIGNDTSELFNMYEMNDNKNIFRTPISIGSGAQFKTDSDDRSNTFKYWIMYLLSSGLYDDALPYINVAKGLKDIVNNTYNLSFWKQDINFKSDVWNNLVGSELFPNRFYNLQTNNYKAGTLASQIYITNDKIFYKYGDTYRDQFNAIAFWQQNKSVLFEAQDLNISAAGLLFMLNYSKKLINWGYGYKYLNLLNVAQLNTKPVSIKELNRNIGFIACENDIYWVNGIDENNISISLIANNVGLEQGNYKAIAGNGNQVFFYNKKGIWVADSSNQYNGSLTPTNGVLSNVFNLTDPIKDYIYMRDSGNVLIYDMVNGLLYIPLDYTRMPSLQSVLKLNDYNVNSTFIANNVIAGSSDSGIAYNNPWAILDYKNLSFRLDSFSDDLASTTYTAFAGYLKDHPIIRNGTKLIIPEYNQAIGTENPLCRIISKRISFGSLHSQKKLNSFMSAFINNINYELQYFGIDHYKITFILDNKYTLSYKYGDYRSDATSYSDVNSAYYSIPTDTNDGWHLQYIPSGVDFNEMVVQIEFTRLKDINSPTSAISQSSIAEFSFNVINKDVKKKGMQ